MNSFFTRRKSADIFKFIAGIGKNRLYDILDTRTVKGKSIRAVDRKNLKLKFI